MPASLSFAVTDCGPQTHHQRQGHCCSLAASSSTLARSVPGISPIRKVTEHGQARRWSEPLCDVAGLRIRCGRGPCSRIEHDPGSGRASARETASIRRAGSVRLPQGYTGVSPTSPGSGTPEAQDTHRFRCLARPPMITSFHRRPNFTCRERHDRSEPESIYHGDTGSVYRASAETAISGRVINVRHPDRCASSFMTVVLRPDRGLTSQQIHLHVAGSNEQSARARQLSDFGTNSAVP